MTNADSAEARKAENDARSAANIAKFRAEFAVDLAAARKRGTERAAAKYAAARNRGADHATALAEARSVGARRK
jgi:hypothetical protein